MNTFINFDFFNDFIKLTTTTEPEHDGTIHMEELREDIILYARKSGTYHRSMPTNKYVGYNIVSLDKKYNEYYLPNVATAAAAGGGGTGVRGGNNLELFYKLKSYNVFLHNTIVLFCIERFLVKFFSNSYLTVKGYRAQKSIIMENCYRTIMDETMKQYAIIKLRKLFAPYITHWLYKPGGIRFNSIMEDTTVGRDS
jgi:hypothetical protein